MSPILFAAVFAVAATQPTVEELQSDFESALECARPVDGRQVWKGQRAFFISSYSQSMGQAAGGSEAADAVLPDDNDPEVIAEFEAACAD
ncbi:hypothetical protein OCK02_08775 [Rhizobium sp. TRM96647]|uniref:hypothetical protein n=1 Tax=unclassified Rhizobium TaxID=2613769 RepID=UPI0021E79BD2|nr:MULTISPECIES: hypothetical protein [unclassified Rhizobium]MCV3736298.1 hypothetical protein [Rhizobium sp. TRM96647]MCV3758667.1 hypothetical protein [Rhizobium sp. TRM96650]